MHISVLISIAGQVWTPGRNILLTPTREVDLVAKSRCKSEIPEVLALQLSSVMEMDRSTRTVA